MSYEIAVVTTWTFFVLFNGLLFVLLENVFEAMHLTWFERLHVFRYQVQYLSKILQLFSCGI